jgi:protoporphyrinogen oxidase
MKEYDIIIAGAGISGLSLAHFCASYGLNTLVLEKTDRVGGSLHTSIINENSKNEFWIELGAHTIYNSYTHVISLLETYGLHKSIIKRVKHPYTVLYKGDIQSIFKHLDYIQLALNIHRLLYIKKSDHTIESYLSGILGIKNYKKLMSHFINAMWSQESDNFPAELLFKKRERRNDLLRSFSLEKGIQSITDAILKNRAVTTLTNSNIVEIVTKRKQWFIKTAENNMYKCQYLAIATPAHETIRLLKFCNGDIARELSEIEVCSTDSIGIIIDRNISSLKSVAGIIPLDDDSFFSVVSKDTIPHTKYRGFTFHFEYNKISYKERLKKISKILGIKNNDYIHIFERKNIMPSLKKGHGALIKKVDSMLYKLPLLLTGNYFNGLAIEDCVLRSYNELYRVFNFPHE